MKRYLVFSFGDYYPAGGWGDFSKDFNNLKEASEHARSLLRSTDNAEVIDTETGEEV